MNTRKLSISNKNDLLNAINNANNNPSIVHDINITTNLIEFSGAMNDDSAIYLENTKVNIIGPPNKVELRGQGKDGNYRIFYLGGGSYHFENLKITNGYQVNNFLYFLYNIFIFKSQFFIILIVRKYFFISLYILSLLILYSFDLNLNLTLYEYINRK